MNSEGFDPTVHVTVGILTRWEKNRTKLSPRIGMSVIMAIFAVSVCHHANHASINEIL